jgi:hypothetical protein
MHRHRHMLIVSKRGLHHAGRETMRSSCPRAACPVSTRIRGFDITNSCWRSSVSNYRSAMCFRSIGSSRPKSQETDSSSRADILSHWLAFRLMFSCTSLTHCLTSSVFSGLKRGRPDFVVIFPTAVGMYVMWRFSAVLFPPLAPPFIAKEVLRAPTIHRLNPRCC